MEKFNLPNTRLNCFRVPWNFPEIARVISRISKFNWPRFHRVTRFPRTREFLNILVQINFRSMLLDKPELDKHEHVISGSIFFVQRRARRVITSSASRVITRDYAMVYARFRGRERVTEEFANVNARFSQRFHRQLREIDDRINFRAYAFTAAHENIGTFAPFMNILRALHRRLWNFINTVIRASCHGYIDKVRNESENAWRRYKIFCANVYFVEIVEILKHSVVRCINKQIFMQIRMFENIIKKSRTLLGNCFIC